MTTAVKPYPVSTRTVIIEKLLIHIDTIVNYLDIKPVYPKTNIKLIVFMLMNVMYIML